MVSIESDIGSGGKVILAWFKHYAVIYAHSPRSYPKMSRLVPPRTMAEVDVKGLEIFKSSTLHLRSTYRTTTGP